MLGLRGVPARQGGVERHVEELGARLAARGHEVTVFCRTNYGRDRRPDHRGMRLRHLPTIGTKHLDAVAHTALATARSLTGYDVVHFHALGPGLLTPLPAALSRAAVVQTVHALDGERAKWGPAARSVLRAAEWASARVPDATITVSAHLARHYRERFGTATTPILNGADAARDLPGSDAGATLRRFGLSPGRYVLFVGRLVPEKGPELLVRAFRRLADEELRLVLVGGSSFTDRFTRRLAALAAPDPRVVLTGYLYGPVLDELYANAAVFVSPSALEGGPPLTLLEAATFGTPVVVSDIPPQLEALDGAGPGRRTFAAGDEGSLAAQLRAALADPGAERSAAQGLRRHVLAHHRWDDVAAATEAVYRGALAAKQAGG